MRVLIQRISSGSVTVNGAEKRSVGQGLCLLVGIENEDNQEDIEWVVKKVLNMRIFGDADGKMNLSIQDVYGEVLLVSQFTLHASTKKGNRPSFIKAARPETAIPLYEQLIAEMRKEVKVETGEFGADMDVDIINQGPVTIWIDSKNKE